jgi:hypothetical protein
LWRFFLDGTDAGKETFLQGVLRKRVRKTWFFDGKFVVN